MTTKIVNVKNWRDNMTKLCKETKGKDIQFIIVSNSVPIFKAEPIHDNQIPENNDWQTKEMMLLADKSWDFWKDKSNDNLFDESISL